MEKKFVWIAALFVALALLITGCPGGGDSEVPPEPVDLEEVFSATEATQDKSTVTITADGATFSGSGDGEMWGELITSENIPLDASKYKGIKFDYKSTGQATIFMQDSNTIFIFAYNGSDGWGAINSAADWTPLTLPFSILENQGWFGDGSAAFNKSAIIKLCFQVDEGPENRKFELRNLELIGTL